MKYVIEIYRLDVVAGTFRRIDIIDRGFKNLTFFNALNAIGAARFDLPIQHPKATEVNLRRFVNHVVIKREDTIVWFGPITNISAEYDNVTGIITVDCNTHLSHLKTRFSNQLDIYTSTDLSTIIWAQIDQAQTRTNGNIGITQGTLQTSSSYSKNLEFRPVSDTLIEFSNYINGFDFSLSAITDGSNLFTGVQFDTFFPRLGYIRTDLPPLQIGVNVKSVQLKTNHEIQNSSIATGSGTGTDVLQSVLNYGASQQAYTRKEVILSFKDESVASVLSARNQAYLNLWNTENYLLNLALYENTRPFLGDYALGDILLLKVEVADASYINLNSTCRVVEISINVQDTGAEIITPKVILLL